MARRDAGPEELLRAVRCVPPPPAAPPARVAVAGRRLPELLPTTPFAALAGAGTLGTTLAVATLCGRARPSGGSGAAMVAGLAVSTVALMAWTQLSWRNLRSLGVEDHPCRRVPVAVDWLVPGVSLVLPFRRVDDLWKLAAPTGTLPGRAWPARRGSVLVRTWSVANAAVLVAALVTGLGAVTAAVAAVQVGLAGASLVAVTRRQEACRLALEHAYAFGDLVDAQPVAA